MSDYKKPPFRITLLLGLVLITTGWNALRLATSVVWHDTLETYIPFPGTTYIVATGAIWTGVGVFVIYSYIRGARWARATFLIAAFAYAIWVWVDRLIVQMDYRANWPFSLALTILLLGYTMVIILDPRNEIYFMKRGL
jgi:uncharacterized membrane protein